MRRLAKIAGILAVLAAIGGLVALGPHGALLFGGFTFAIAFMLLVLGQGFLEMLDFGPEKVTPPPTPAQVLQEQASLQAAGAHRFAFVLLVSHLPGGVRHEVRLRLWDSPEWRGTVQTLESKRNRDGSLAQTELRNSDLEADEVARFRELLEKHGTGALQNEPFRVRDGSPAVLYLLEKGVAPFGTGHMNLFHLPGDRIFDQATYDFFMAVLRAAGLGPSQPAQRR